jgi:membrane-associated phospholipid phosphatase
MQRPRFVTVAWLALLAAANAALLLLVMYVALGTIRGQMLDTVALSGNDLGRRTVDGPLNVALNAISVVSLAVVLIVVGLVALVRRRYGLAIMSVVLVVGSALTTYVLKHYLITRPEFGVDLERTGAGNSLPSGHATAAAAFAIGLVLVLPPSVRGLASFIGANYAAVVGVATLSSGWHRPSDVIASYLIVGGWSAFAGLLLVLTQPRSAVVSSRDRHDWSLAATLGGGLVLLGAGAFALTYTFVRMTEPVAQMSARLLNIGYLGSALAVAGAAYLMMAVVLVTVHRVVPHSETATAAEPALAGSVR